MIPLVVAAVALVGATVLAALIIFLARAVVYPRRSRPTHIVEVQDPDRITVSKTPLTSFSGTIGLLYSNETQLAVLSPGVDPAPTPDAVVRRLAQPARVEPGTLGRACGNVFSPSTVVAAAPVDVDVVTEASRQPAWLYPGSGEPARVWVIHVHGMLAGRDSALRSVHALSKTGFPSLVISYRGDGEAEDERPTPSALGQQEWRHLDAAVRFARAQGAERVAVVGWSMGATIALEALTRGTDDDGIEALVLVSPAICWARTIRFGMARQRIPLWLANATIWALSTHVVARSLGLRAALALPDGMPTVSVPTLIIHSRGDSTTPFDASEALALSSPAVDLDEFPESPHAMEWNADPERFRLSTSSWLVAHLLSDRTHPDR